MGNCPVEGVVDFGRGPVIVRCTKQGSHTQHICLVEIEVAENKSVPTPEKGEAVHNIFDPKNEGVNPLHGI